MIFQENIHHWIYSDPPVYLKKDLLFLLDQTKIKDVLLKSDVPLHTQGTEAEIKEF